MKLTETNLGRGKQLRDGGPLVVFDQVAHRRRQSTAAGLTLVARVNVDTDARSRVARNAKDDLTDWP